MGLITADLYIFSMEKILFVVKINSCDKRKKTFSFSFGFPFVAAIKLTLTESNKLITKLIR